MNDIRVAIILPTSLKYANYKDLKKLSSFENVKKIKYGMFMAVDEDDNYNINKLKKIFKKSDNIIIKKFPISKPPKICNMWKIMSQIAYNKNYDLFLLLGDDIEIYNNWYEEIINLFKEISKNNNVPFGFGCVCIKDKTSPNFPTFPVIHKKHIDIFGNIFPDEFINQDADPYLYELYRRFNCIKYTKESFLINKRGGVTYGLNYTNKPLYNQIHIEWREEILTESINIIKNKYKNIKNIITLDIIIPCYRVNEFYLEKIFNINKDKRVDHRFIVIIDKNIKDIKIETYNYLKLCEEKYNVRIRVNQENMGASYSRNKGLKESHSDWILYLDDDVIPDKNIISNYINILLKNIEKDGFVGNSILEKNKYHSTDAVHMAQTTFFWNISEKFEYVPWGVTANLLVKRYNNIEFDLDFPKTGGGEDIDFCLKLKNWPLVSVENAIIIHPWWNDGKRIYMWKRFIKWALGDGLLIKKYPKFTYRTLPNIWEWSLLLLIVSLVINLYDRIFILWIAEFISGTIWIYFKKENCSYLKGLRRLSVSLESNLVRNSSELGHIIRHINDFNYLNLTKRFDWFCGLYPEGIKYEKTRSLFHNFIFLIFIILYEIYKN